MMERMIFILISVIVPIAIAVILPRLLLKYGYREKKYRIFLYIACALFFIAYYVPSPLIDGKDTSFMTHLIGGGLFTGFLWLYIKSALGWKKRWVIEAITLYGFVSGLGCLNELAELGIKRAGLHNLPLDDTNWDIVANTLGAAIFFVIYEIYRRSR